MEAKPAKMTAPTRIALTTPEGLCAEAPTISATPREVLDAAECWLGADG
jgi:hypothetical protein